MKKAMYFIKSYNCPPFSINVGFILNHYNRDDPSTFRYEMYAQAVKSSCEILYPEFFAHKLL